MNKDAIDVDYTDVDGREYFTLEEAAEVLEIEIDQVIFWCNKFEDVLKINSIGQFKIFSKEDIRNLKTIKNLNLEQKMSVNETKQYLRQNDKAIVVRKDNELDISIFNFFSNIVNTQNQKIDKLMEMQTQSLQMFTKMCSEIAIESEEKDKLLNQILENQEQSKIDISNKIDDNVINIQNLIDRNSEEHDIKLINDLSKHLAERRLEQEQFEKEKSKGLFGKWFKK